MGAWTHMRDLQQVVKLAVAVVPALEEGPAAAAEEERHACCYCKSSWMTGSRIEVGRLLLQLDSGGARRPYVSSRSSTGLLWSSPDACVGKWEREMVRTLCVAARRTNHRERWRMHSPESETSD